MLHIMKSEGDLNQQVTERGFHYESRSKRKRIQNFTERSI